MPVIQEKVDGHLKIVSFQESPIMSTYLVAVVIGLFDYAEGLTLDGMYFSLSFVSCMGVPLSLIVLSCALRD